MEDRVAVRAPQVTTLRPLEVPNARHATLEPSLLKMERQRVRIALQEHLRGQQRRQVVPFALQGSTRHRLVA